MRRPFGLPGLAVLVMLVRVTPASAQGATADVMLARAIAALDSTETERGQEMLGQLLAALPAGSSRASRINVYVRYAEASWALGARDSLLAPLAAAVREDPFLELDPDRFNPEIINAFRAAKRRVVAVGLRAPRDTTLRPDVDTWPVTIGVGQPGPVRLVLRRLAPPGRDSTVVTLTADAVGRAAVSLTDASRTTLAPGAYRLTAVFGDSGLSGPQSAIEFDINRAAVDTFPLEPPLDAGSFRVETRKGSWARSALLGGLGFAALVSTVPMVMSNGELDIAGVDARALAVGAAAGLAGLAGAQLGRPTVPIQVNIDYNKALRDAREQRNRAITAQNAVLTRFAPLRISVRSQP